MQLLNVMDHTLKDIFIMRWMLLMRYITYYCIDCTSCLLDLLLNCTILSNLITVIPRLAQFCWQEKNRVNRVRWNSCYASQKATFYTGCPRGIVDIWKKVLWLHFWCKEPIQSYSFEFILKLENDLKIFFKKICIALYFQYFVCIKSCYESFILLPQKFMLCKFVLWEIVLAEGWLYTNNLSS